MQHAADRAQHEGAERVGLARRHDRQPVRRHAGRRERAVVAAEHGDAPHLMPALVAAEPEILERAAHACAETVSPRRRPRRRGCRRCRTARGSARRRSPTSRRRGRRRARRGSRALRRPGTGTARAATGGTIARARASRWSRIADRRGVVVGAGAARHRVVMRVEHEHAIAPPDVDARSSGRAPRRCRRRARVYGTPRALRNRATAASRATLSRPSRSRESASGSSLAPEDLVHVRNGRRRRRRAAPVDRAARARG